MAVHPTDRVAYVTNGISGTVSVVDLVQGRVAATDPGGTEPRGCALTPDGSLLYVANHTAGHRIHPRHRAIRLTRSSTGPCKLDGRSHRHCDHG